jgi:hypothetical protein
MVKKSKIPIKNVKVKELQKKLNKVKGDIHISKRKTWFSEAMESLEKENK